SAPAWRSRTERIAAMPGATANASRMVTSRCPNTSSPYKGRPLALGQLAKRQVAGLGPIRHPLGNHLIGWCQHDQGQLSTIDGDRGGRRLVVLEGLREGGQDHLGVVVAQLLPATVELTLHLGLLLDGLLAGCGQ